MIARCEFDIQHAQMNANKLREEAEKAKLLAVKEIEAGKMKISKSKHTETKSQVTDNDYICDHCEEEFNNEKLHREHTHSCPICKVTNIHTP